MTTPSERQQIKQLLQTPQWTTAERVANLLIEQTRDHPVLAETEWQTMQNLLMREGEARGIKRFINELYQQAQNT